MDHCASEIEKKWRIIASSSKVYQIGNIFLDKRCWSSHMTLRPSLTGTVRRADSAGEPDNGPPVYTRPEWGPSEIPRRKVFPWDWWGLRIPFELSHFWCSQQNPQNLLKNYTGIRDLKLRFRSILEFNFLIFFKLEFLHHLIFFMHRKILKVPYVNWKQNSAFHFDPMTFFQF